MSMIALIVMLFSKEKKKWIVALLSYPKNTNYVESIYSDTFGWFTIFVSFYIFGIIYLQNQFMYLLLDFLVLIIVFLAFFIKTNVRSFKTIRRQFARLRNYKKFIASKKFNISLIICIVLILSFDAGNKRFHFLTNTQNIIGMSDPDGNQYGVVGFIGGSPLKVRKLDNCMEFSVMIEGEVLSANRCTSGSVE